MTRELDIRTACKSLPVSELKVRAFLKQIGAIQKTDWGYQATRTYREKGLLKTDTRQKTIRTEWGAEIPKLYTVPLLTPNGMVWLQQQLIQLESM